MAFDFLLLIAIALLLIALVFARLVRRQQAVAVRAQDEPPLCMAQASGQSPIQSAPPPVSKPDAADRGQSPSAKEQLLAEIWEREKTQEQLEATLKRFKALFELAPDAVILASESGTVTDANLAAASVFGYSRQEMQGLSVSDLVPRGAVLDVTHKQARMIETRGVAKGGRVFPVELSSRHVGLEQDMASLIMVRDISRRKQSERELRTLTLAVEQSPASVVITDPKGNILYVNPRFCELSGYAKAEVLGRDMRFLCPDEQAERSYDQLWEAVSQGRQWRGEICCANKAGQTRWELASISPVTGENGELLYYVAIKEDITEKRRREQAIKQMAMFDMLTGLPNRALLTDRLDLALAQAERGGEMAAVLYLDLDGFKIINDNHGHETGDAVLKEVGRRIEKSIRKVDTAARMGGDEFVVVLRAVKRHVDVDATALRIIASLNEPFHVLGQAYHVGVSIGVSLSPVHSKDRDELIRMADHAMYKVKEMGKNNFRYYDPFEEAAETA